MVVTQAAAGQQPVSRPTQKVTEWREPAAPRPAAVAPNTTHPQEVEPSSAPAPSVTQPPQPNTNYVPPTEESSLPQQPQDPAADTLLLQGADSPEPEFRLEESEPSPQPEPMNLSMTASPCGQSLDFQTGTEETLTQTAPLKSRDVDDILKQVIEEEREKAERARSLTSAKTDSPSEAVLGVFENSFFLFLRNYSQQK